MIRHASLKDLRRWLHGQIVLIGGTWHEAPHGGGDFADGHDTPIGRLPGVLLHANYVQSLLWGAMFGVSEGWRITIEIALSLGMSIIFLLATGWRRLALILFSIAMVLILTWIFSAAIGIFFDVVIPIAFLGIHALSEEFGEHVQIVGVARQRLTTVLSLVAVILVAIVFVREGQRIDRDLLTEHRLQVTSATPLQQDPILAVTARLPFFDFDPFAWRFRQQTLEIDQMEREVAVVGRRMESLRSELGGLIDRSSPPSEAQNSHYLEKRAAYERARETYERLSGHLFTAVAARGRVGADVRALELDRAMRDAATR